MPIYLIYNASLSLYFHWFDDQQRPAFGSVVGALVICDVDQGERILQWLNRNGDQCLMVNQDGSIHKRDEHTLAMCQMCQDISSIELI